MIALSSRLERCKGFKAGRVFFSFNVHTFFERENFLKGL
jgi:hypothetical protein